MRHLANPIPLPWGGSTSSLTLSPGLNDLLIPRELFLYSPFGQAVLLGRNTSYNTSNGAPPLVGTSEQSYLTGFVGANLMVDLGAYWQNRSIETGTAGNITPLTEAGTAAASNLELQVMAAPSATGSNTGGLPSNPTLYQDAGGNPSAVQTIVTLNVTSTTTLDLLLAAILDNTTGGPNAVNGTFQSVTYQVGFLGLDATIANAVPNATELNDGLWGPPTSEAPSKQPSSLFGSFWNAVTSFVTNPLGTVVSLMYTVWDAAEAAAVYLDHLVSEANEVGAQIKARTAAAVVHAGTLLVSKLLEFLSWLITEVEELVSPEVDALADVDLSFTGSLASDLQEGMNDTFDGHALPISDANRYWKDFTGSIFLLAVSLSAVLEVALWLIMGFSLGAGFLAGAVVGVALSASLQHLLSGPQPIASSGYSGVAPFTIESVWLTTTQLNRSSLGASLRSNSDYLPAMDVSAGMLSDVLAGGSVLVALIGIIFLSADAAAVLGLVLAIVGLFTAIAAQIAGNFVWGTVSVITDVESLAVDFTSLSQKDGRSGTNLIVNGVGLGLDVASTYIDFKSALGDGP